MSYAKTLQFHVRLSPHKLNFSPEISPTHTYTPPPPLRLPLLQEAAFGAHQRGRGEKSFDLLFFLENLRGEIGWRDSLSLKDSPFPGAGVDAVRGTRPSSLLDAADANAFSSLLER